MFFSEFVDTLLVLLLYDGIMLSHIAEAKVASNMTTSVSKGNVQSTTWTFAYEIFYHLTE